MKNMEQRLATIIYISIIFTFVKEMSTAVQNKDNNKRRIKEKSSGFQKNICDITDRESKVHCYCENSREPRNAIKAECWVFNGGIPRDDPIWKSFASQPLLQTLSFNVRVDGALNYIPTKPLQFLQRLKYINIKYGNLVNITSFALANLTNLKEATLSLNQIETLKPYAFAHLPNMTVINLEENMILEIGRDTFFDLPKLQKLIFTKNNISLIYDGAFQHTFNLLELDLNKNSIYSLNRQTFDGLANLRKLDLRKNRIYNLTEFTFAELWNLQELLLGNNDIKYISERAFDGLSQLRKLSLDDNDLAFIPSGLFEGVRGLRVLDLRSNELHKITYDDIKPILDNLKSTSSSLLLEENKYVCDCRLKWIYVLRDETESQNTKDSLEKITCKVEEPIVSSAYNRMDSSRIDDINDKHLILSNDTLNLKNDKNIIVKMSEIKENNQTTKGEIRNVLEILPESLPCPVVKSKTTKLPFVIDYIKPLDNNIINLRFQEMNTGNTASFAKCIFSVLFFLLFFT